MKIRGTIRGRSIFLDTLPGFGMDQRVEVDITPVEDTSEKSEAKLAEADTREPTQKRKDVTTLSDILADMGITREELDARVEADPFIREARKRRKKWGKLRDGESDLITQWIREDRDR